MTTVVVHYAASRSDGSLVVLLVSARYHKHHGVRLILYQTPRKLSVCVTWGTLGMLQAAPHAQQASTKMHQEVLCVVVVPPVIRFHLVGLLMPTLAQRARRIQAQMATKLCVCVTWGTQGMREAARHAQEARTKIRKETLYVVNVTLISFRLLHLLLYRLVHSVQ